MSNPDDRNGVLTAGNFIVDTVKLIDQWPQQDALCSIRSRTRSNGGGPYNILKNLARLVPELRLEACGLLGDDPEGQWILEDCAGAGIDTTQLIVRSGISTSVTDAMTVRSTGRRTFFHERGANAELDENHFDFSRSQAKIFSLGYLMLLDKLDVVDDNGSTGAARLLKSARAAGMITAVDIVSTPHAKFREIAVAALKEADIFFVNELEAGLILGCEVTPHNQESSVKSLANLGSRGIVVLHMPAGAVAYSGAHAAAKESTKEAAKEALYFQPSVNFPNEQIAGTSGAGDAFAAGFLYATHEGWPLQDALHCAVCVAAMSLTHATPSDGIASLSQCLKLGERYGFKNA